MPSLGEPIATLLPPHAHAPFSAIRRRRYDEVIEQCGLAIQQLPNDHRPLFMRGYSYAQQGLHDLALPDLEAGMECFKVGKRERERERGRERANAALAPPRLP